MQTALSAPGIPLYSTTSTYTYLVFVLYNGKVLPKPLPDRHIHMFRAQKSVDRRV